MKTPDITPQAIGAFIILFATNIMILFGLNLSPRKEASLEALINGAAVVAFLLHDAIVRHGRATGGRAKLPPASPPA